MARVNFHSVLDNWYARLNAGINNSVTSAVMKEAATAPTAPFYLLIDSEIVEVTNVAVDTPSGGLDTITIVRGVAGSSNASHLEDAYFQVIVLAQQTIEIQNKIKSIEDLLLATMGVSVGGTNSGIQKTKRSALDLKVIQQSSPDMTVRIKVGAAIVSGEQVSVRTAIDTDTIVAPSVNPRKDVVSLAQDGTITVTTGVEAGSPSAPSTPANELKLAELDVIVSQSSITTSDITDSRVYL